MTAANAGSPAPDEQGARDNEKTDNNSKLARMCALAGQQVSPELNRGPDLRQQVRLRRMTGARNE
jgi:hypothetical protein